MSKKTDGLKDASSLRPDARVDDAMPDFIKVRRGVADWKEVGDWLDWRGIEDIECITPDQAGVPRGKMMPTSKFTSNTSLSLPSSVFRQTISGEYPPETNDFRYDPHDGDLKLVPDLRRWPSCPGKRIRRHR